MTLDRLKSFGLKASDSRTEVAGPDNIAQLEARIGASLPVAYRNFLLQTGGGCFASQGLIFKAGPHQSTMDTFYGWDSNESLDFLGVMGIYEGRISPDYLVIGNDGMSNQILLGLRGDEEGKIFYWDCEDEEYEDMDYRGNIHMIASGFEEFIDGLKVEDWSEEIL